MVEYHDFVRKTNDFNEFLEQLRTKNVYKLPVSGWERILRELAESHPRILAGSGEHRLWAGGMKYAMKAVESYPVSGVEMGDRCQKVQLFDLPAGFFTDFPKSAFYRRFSLFEPAAGKFPQTPPDIIG